MTEYVLQKKLLGRWDYVTWYGADELDKAQRSYNNMTKGDTGYSWRLVRLETLHEKLLDGSREIEKEEAEVEQPVASNSWNNVASSFSTPAPKPDHKLSGSVWVGNPITKEKKRVPAAEAATMLEQGWIKAGPRTVL